MKNPTQPPTARLFALRSWAEEWLKPHSRGMRQAVLALTRDSGFAPEMSRLGLEFFFERLLRDARPSAQAKLKRLGWTPESVWTVVTPGNVPTPLLAVVAAGILSGARVWIKSSSSHRRFTGIVATSLKNLKISPIQINTSRSEAARRIASADRAIVFGGDETLRQMRGISKDPSCLVSRGERGSVALIDDRGQPRGWIQKKAKETALDIWLYDQRGCLSPRAVFVRENPHFFAQELHRQLKELSLKEGQRTRPVKWRQQRDAALTEITARSVGIKKFQVFGDPKNLKEPIVFEASDLRFIDIKVTGQVISVLKMKNPATALKRLPFALAGISVAGPFKTARHSLLQSPEVWITEPGLLQKPPTFWNLRAQ